MAWNTAKFVGFAAGLRAGVVYDLNTWNPQDPLEAPRESARIPHTSLGFQVYPLFCFGSLACALCPCSLRSEFLKMGYPWAPYVGTIKTLGSTIRIFLGDTSGVAIT